MSRFLQFLNGTGNAADSGKKRDGRKAEKGSGLDTHNFMTGGSYQIDPEEMPEFYKLYCDHLRQFGPLTLTEKGSRIGSLRVDLDLIYSGQVSDHKHTREQTVAFVKAYMAEVQKYLIIKDNVEVYVLEKEYPVYEKQKNRSKSGIHIMVPSLKTDRHVEEAVRHSLLKKMESFFPDLGLAEDWRKVYDPAPLTHTSNWTMLGSKKDGGLPYEFKYIVDWDPTDGEVGIDDEVPLTLTPELVAKFSIRSSAIDETLQTDFAREQLRQSEDTPRISGGRAVSAPRGRPTSRGAPGGGGADSRGSSPTRAVMQQPLTDVQKKYYEAHTMNLADTRYTDYQTWINVGICLKNIHPDLEDVFLEFSQQYEKFDRRETNAKWDSFGFRNDGEKLGVGSLRAWSRQDNPDKYTEIEKSNTGSLMRTAAETQTEYDVAEVVYSLYRDEYKCARASSSAWYRFVGHTWKETDKGISLQCKLSGDLVKVFYRQVSSISDRLAEMDPCTADKKLTPDCFCDRCREEKVLAGYNALINKLKTVRFTENVMKMARLVFLDEEFAEKLDENKNLIAFRNGVFDMTNYTFRPGKAEDYLSFCTNMDYDDHMPYYQHTCWSEMDKFIRDVLPDGEVRAYFMSYLSNCLNGNHSAQKFHILTGSGSNGKSMLMNLMRTALGDYACTVPISLLTQARNKSSAAAPEMVRTKGRRFVTMQEPDEQCNINTGLMKELASSEKIICRDLYQGSKQMIEFDLQARFNLACNEKPKINTQDGGTWRRLVVINFTSKFVSKPTLSHEKPIDESFVHKTTSSEWAACFMSYLIHLYIEGNGFHKLDPPEKVMEYTSDYKDENDVIARFIKEKLHGVEEAGDKVSQAEVKVAFNEWKRSNDIDRGAGKIADMVKRVTETFGSGWNKFRIGDAA